MAGLPVLLVVSTSLNRAVVQGEGTAMRMNVAALRKEFKQDGLLQSLLRRYTHAFMTQISQSAACTNSHRLEERLARWLLMAQDRSGADELRLSQEFLSDMVGVRREAVSKAASDFQKQKLICYSRGHITILNRPGLKAISCKCYSVVKDEHDRFLTNH